MEGLRDWAVIAIALDSSSTNGWCKWERSVTLGGWYHGAAHWLTRALFRRFVDEIELMVPRAARDLLRARFHDVVAVILVLYDLGGPLQPVVLVNSTRGTSGSRTSRIVGDMPEGTPWRSMRRLE